MKLIIAVFTTLFAIIANINCANAGGFVTCTSGTTNFARCAAEWESAFHTGIIKDTDAAWDVAYYRGYIDGVLISEQGKGIWCTNKMIPMDQIYALTAKDVRENPDKWSYSPRYFVIKALSEAYPCGHTRKKTP